MLIYSSCRYFVTAESGSDLINKTNRIIVQSICHFEKIPRRLNSCTHFLLIVLNQMRKCSKILVQLFMISTPTFTRKFFFWKIRHTLTFLIILHIFSTFFFQYFMNERTEQEQCGFQKILLNFSKSASVVSTRIVFSQHMYYVLLFSRFPSSVHTSRGNEGGHT